MKPTNLPKGRPQVPRKLDTPEITDLQPPAWFSAYAVLAFHELKPHVLNKCKGEDVPLFLTMCCQFGKVMEAEETIKEHGLTVRNEKGALVKNPVFAVLKEATQVFNSLTSRFGMSPVDRARTNADTAATTEANSPMARLLLQANQPK